VLKGENSRFLLKEYSTDSPMETGKIYILHEHQKIPIEVLPLIALGEPPTKQDNTIYFYNKFEDQQARMTSYIHSKAGKILIDSKPIFEVLSALHLIGKE
jgi:hypothetical protein